ncbi:BMP family ABC transporter substrate-binding protein [Clostridium estertheticum]|uniref:BMP family ABC transporter substrate-binding protein n=1 Tax=Clostridium estertheticum TaxID=238834 RepID=A0A7Y3T0F9_9CLOT|nr:BMP family ABC transporter substrate-binding protein [Clostridium estertheticum]NNU77812.1 BMP family ABC transporter substrate-binding protein [Clostridium estertheticum]WBL45486.1 BMP family ABC transporter substrate-binding protein [Clostridium estertheticum]
MKCKKLVSLVMSMSVITMVFAGCSSSEKSATKPATTTKVAFKDGMVTDTGGVNDQSFNQGSWKGLQSFAKNNPGAQVKYLESVQSSNYPSNLNQFASNKYDLVWGIGYLMEDAVKASAKAYPNVKFAVIDDAMTPHQSNVTGVIFKAQESSFLVGYIAALKTKTNKVGFIGGITGNVIDQFDYGFRAGVAYGAKELKKTVTVNVQYANSFSDSALGKAISQNMYSKGADIIFTAAGNVGQGMVAEAKSENKLCIGVDMDQAYLAPNNMLTSSLKNVSNVTEALSKQVKDGVSVGGKTLSYGLKDNGVGVPYTAQAIKMCGQDVLDKTKKVSADVVSGKIVPPYNKDTFGKYITSLK